MRILFVPHATGLRVTRGNYPLRSTLPLDTCGTLAELGPDLEWISPNNGNMIHNEACAKIFACDRELSTIGRLPSLGSDQGNGALVKRVENNFDRLVLSYANIIRDSSRLPGDVFETMERNLLSQARFLEQSRIPVSVFGLGLQHDLPARPDAIAPNLLRLLRAMNARSDIISVRGPRTEAFLRGIGIDKAVAMGCQSLFVNPAATLNIAAPRAEAPLVTTAGRLSKRRWDEGRTQPLLTIAEAFQTDYTFQNDLWGMFPKKRHGEVPYNSETGEVGAQACNAQLTRFAGPGARFGRYWFHRTPDAWRTYAATRDLYLGDRFHGGVAFLQAGRPAGFIYDDIRVKELTEFFDLPRYSIADVMERGAREIVEEIRSPERMEAFRSRYAERLKAFTARCTEIGLPPRQAALAV